MKFFCTALLSTFGLIALYSETTSSSDDGLYPGFCLQAAQNEAVFASFKQNPIYTNILEHVNYEQGSQYLIRILKQTPNFSSFFAKFQENDTLGNPRTYSYENAGVFSPTTLRYVKTVSDLTLLFNGLNDMNIIEIGGGYGGLCKIIKDVYNYASYTIVDLPEVLPLIEKYLSTLGVHNVQLRTLEQLDGQQRYDLVISNYAFTECIKPIQEIYLNKILSVSSRGFITCNHVPGANVWSKEELAKKLTASHIHYHELPEDPLTFEGNYCIYWN